MVIDGLKNKFSNIHPLIFHRSQERAKTPGELFDILDTIPVEYPLIWNEDTKRWMTTKDIFQIKSFTK